MEIDPQKYEYIARVNWLPDGTLTAQLENRRQTQLDLMQFDLTSGKASRLLQEKVISGSICMISFSHSRRMAKKNAPVLSGLLNERVFAIYIYTTAKGNCSGRSQKEDWQVDSLVKVDQKAARFISLPPGRGYREPPL